MLNLDTFITDEILTAQPHPLTENIGLIFSDGEVASTRTEIWEMQRRDRIPGLMKRSIPLDYFAAWEYWWCIPGRMLLPEDRSVLRSDRQRVETILEQLVWLLGGHCFAEHTRFDGENNPIYEWQEVLTFVKNCHINSDVLDIDFFPTALHKINHKINGIPEHKISDYIAIEPAHLHIEFFPLQAIEGGFKLQEPKPLCSCQIWTGKPFIKNLKTGETITRYDLFISYPHDMIRSPS